MNKYEIELGLWIPIISAGLICAALVFAGYRSGQYAGRKEGFIAGVEYVQQDVIRQCDSPFHCVSGRMILLVSD